MVWLLIVLLLLVFVLAAVFSPWRWPQAGRADSGHDEVRHAAAEVQDLEAARDAKYREIRDAELDRETGHLSVADFTSVDVGLRAEAVEILQRLDRAQTRLEKLQREDGSAGHVDISWTRTDPSESRANALKQPAPAQPDDE